MRSRKNGQKPGTAAPPGPKRGVKLEWAFLLYPACVLAALVVLYVVNRSIETELPVPPAQRSATPQATVAGRSGQPGSPSLATNGDSAAQAVPAAQPAGSDGAVGAATEQAPGQDGLDPNVASAVAAADEAWDPADFDSLEGPARVVAILRMAVQAKDPTRIKECLNELVALGDAAVVSLNDLVHNEGEAGLWAAEALARIGTPMATSALLDTLGQTKEGLFKEELCRRVSNITNHDSWPLLLDTMAQTGDAAVARAASVSLSRMADTPVIDEIVARYDMATTVAEAERLARLIGDIQSPKASDALLALAGDVTSAPADALQQAAIDALANVGDARSVSHLIQRLEAAAPGEGTSVYNAITRISNTDAQNQLLYAAAGNKEVSAESGRTAAIEALRNYPNEETCALLERIVAQEANEKVVTAASRVLDDIRRAPHAVTVKADTLKKSEEMLPITSIMK